MPGEANRARWKNTRVTENQATGGSITKRTRTRVFFRKREASRCPRQTPPAITVLYRRRGTKHTYSSIRAHLISYTDRAISSVSSWRRHQPTRAYTIRCSNVRGKSVDQSRVRERPTYLDAPAIMLQEKSLLCQGSRYAYSLMLLPRKEAMALCGEDVLAIDSYHETLAVDRCNRDCLDCAPDELPC